MAYLVEVGQRFVVLDERVGEVHSLLGVGAHDTPEEVHVVGLEGHFLGVEDYLLELASLREALDHLHAFHIWA